MKSRFNYIILIVLFLSLGVVIGYQLGTRNIIEKIENNPISEEDILLNLRNISFETPKDFVLESQNGNQFVWKTADYVERNSVGFDFGNTVESGAVIIVSYADKINKNFLNNQNFINFSSETKSLNEELNISEMANQEAITSMSQFNLPENQYKNGGYIVVTTYIDGYELKASVNYSKDYEQYRKVFESFVDSINVKKN